MWGEALIEVLNKNRYRYIQFGYRYAFYQTKSAEIAGNPQFRGVSPSNDIIILEKHHVLALKRDCERTRCAMPRKKKINHLDFLLT